MDKIKEEIFSTVQNAMENGIDEEAFERARKVICGQFISTLDSVEGLGNEYMFAYHKGVNLFDYVKICDSITKEDVKPRLNELFKKEQCSMSVVLPKENNE